MFKTSVGIPVLIAAVSACATLQLTPSGSKTQLVSSPPPQLLSDYIEVGVLWCSRGSWHSLKKNIVQCQNELRNKTADVGGVILVLTSQQLGDHECSSCVTMVGTAYAPRPSSLDGQN